MSKLLSIVEEEKPWFSEGLRFKCTECGQCCTGAPGYVWVTVSEIEAIADHFKMEVDEFTKRYIRQVDGRFSITEHPENFDCAFLKDKKCSIYSVRPRQCRTFPWWIKNLKDKKSWQSAAEYCEGINHPDAPVVSCDAIKKQI